MNGQATSCLIGRVTSMTSKEICEILKASKGTGVSEIKLDKLVIKFDNLTNQIDNTNNSTIAIPNNSTSHIVEQVSFLGEEKDINPVIDEFTMANLMVNDPEAFEKRQREL